MSREINGYLDLETESVSRELVSAINALPTELITSRDIDMKDPVVQDEVRRLADKFLEVTSDEGKDLEALEAWICDPNRKGEFSLYLHTAIKLSISKQKIMEISEPTDIIVVVPVYHESVRIRPRVSNYSTPTYRQHGAIALFTPHLHGEDFVSEKKSQGEWLFNSNSLVKHRFIYVDDGCDLQSGKLVEHVVNSNGWKDSHDIFYLQEAIQSKRNRQKGILYSSIEEFNSPKESQKAGAVYLGMAQAVSQGADIIIFTDADVSYNLGLSGYLVHPIAKKETGVTVVNRRDELSVLEEATGDSFNLGRARMKAMLGSIRTTLFGNLLPPDTQPGFKALRRDVVEKLLLQPNKEKGFSFDVQMLARASRSFGNTASVPTVCLDSSAETTADNDKTYFEMIRTFVRIANDMGLGSHEVVAVLTDLGYDLASQERIIWKEMIRLMGIDLFSDIANLSGYDKENLSILQESFSNNGNSTFSNKTLESNLLERLGQLIGEIRLNKNI